MSALSGPMSWVLGITALGFLIVVHEAGHFFVARWCKMRVERFSLGFGPAILKRKAKSGTVFQLAPIPFGGFVEIRGMNLVEDIDPEDKEAYPNRPAWQRFVTIFAGPATNYISAIFLAFGLYTCHGVDSAERWWGVSAVTPGYDAESKLRPGDRILAINDTPIFAANPAGNAAWLGDRVNASATDDVKVTVRRDGKTVEVQLHVKPGVASDGKPMVDKAGRPVRLLGIAPNIQVDQIDVGIIGAAGAALSYPVRQTVAIGEGLYKIISGEEKADVGGGVRITSELANSFGRSIAEGIGLLMMLSVYLGLMNLFPLPALDGGRLVFLGYELITRRRANPKIESTVHMAGIMVLIVVMVLVTLHDFHLF